MLSLNTNLTSLMVQRNLAKASAGVNSAIEKLTTGYKINHAKDNPAGYAMMRGMETKLKAWERAADNISIGSNLLETASSSAELMTKHLTRIRDLCQQACNGTYGENSIKAIKSEIMARVDEVKRIKECTEFNDIKLFGETDSNGDVVSKTINIQVGIDSSASSRVEIDTTLSINGIDDIENWDITSSECLDKVDDMIEELALYETKIGASQNRLEFALEYTDMITKNLTSSLSTVRDADIAEVSSELIRQQILQQACATLLATANQMPALALQLL